VTTPAAELAVARALAGQGRLDEAERIYLRLARAEPPPLEAFSFLALRAFRRGKPNDAARLLEQALAREPANAHLLTDAGVVYRAQNKLERAYDRFVAAVRAAPENYVARLYLGTVCERMGRTADALRHWFAAIETAQLQGQWVSAGTVAPALAAEVAHAMQAVARGRRALFGEILDRLHARFGREAMTRVDKFLAIQLGELAAGIPDARQRPLYFYFPDLPRQHYFERAQIPWVEALEAETEAIREEAYACVAAGNLPSFLKDAEAQGPATYLRGTRGPPTWDAFFFYRDGEKNADNHARAPRTAAAIEAAPLVRIKKSAPEICFSVLAPGSEITTHTGVANFRMVVHLPLIVPDNCALMVAGETRPWVEGRCLAFDDTYEHAAWNRSDGYIRVVLLMDAWNPHLTEAERAAIVDLVDAIGDFNREALAPL
jgi:aspartate beta-hydroxylase